MHTNNWRIGIIGLPFIFPRPETSLQAHVQIRNRPIASLARLQPKQTRISDNTDSAISSHQAFNTVSLLASVKHRNNIPGFAVHVVHHRDAETLKMANF
jgi:hypothetical protein